jgi:hypothetical protein
MKRLLTAALITAALTGAADAQGCPGGSTCQGFNSWLQSLPQAGTLTPQDSIYLLQGGASKQTTVGALATALGISLPAIDLNFAAGTYSGLSCTTATACVSASNNGGYAQWRDGHWSSFPSNSARITDLGVLVETVATTNSVPWSRDLSHWTNTNLTSTLTATGIDNVANSASRLTATSANGTSCVTVSLTNAPFNEITASVSLQRVSGTGEVDVSVEPAPGHSGTVWSPVTKGSGALSTTWQRYVVTFIVSNPTFCIRVAASGDVVNADFAQIEPRLWATSPILTAGAAATRQPDDISFISSANTTLNASATSAVLYSSGAAAANFRHQISSPWFGGSPAGGYLWQFGAMAAFFNNGLGSQGGGTTPYSICGNTALIAADQSLALPVIFGYAWSSAGLLAGCDGGSIQYGTGPGTAPASQTWYIGSATNGPTAYTSRVTLFSGALSAKSMQSITDQTNTVIITDPSPTSGWNNYSSSTTFPATVGGTLPPFQGGPTQNDYGIETGLNSFGSSAPIQLGSTGNLIRFNMFANNCWAFDLCMIGAYGGSERTELDGSSGAGGTANWTTGTDAWLSFSRCIEPGPPLTSNWFFTGQTPGVFSIGTNIGEFTNISVVTGGVANSETTLYEYRQLRGVWENFVLQLNYDPTGATGKVNAWINGVQVVNYAGPTSYTGGPAYWKFGAYRGQSPEYEAVRYANMTYSSSSLASKISSPDAIPSGYGTTCQ